MELKEWELGKIPGLELGLRLKGWRGSTCFRQLGLWLRSSTGPELS